MLDIPDQTYQEHYEQTKSALIQDWHDKEIGSVEIVAIIYDIYLSLEDNDMPKNLIESSKLLKAVLKDCKNQNLSNKFNNILDPIVKAFVTLFTLDNDDIVEITERFSYHFKSITPQNINVFDEKISRIVEMHSNYIKNEIQNSLCKNGKLSIANVFRLLCFAIRVIDNYRSVNSEDTSQLIAIKIVSHIIDKDKIYNVDKTLLKQLCHACIIMHRNCN